MCVRMGRVWDRVSVCTCGHILGSCKCVYVLTEFAIVKICVRVDRVWDRVSVRMYGQSLVSYEFVYVWTECVSLYQCVYVWTEFGSK